MKMNIIRDAKEIASKVLELKLGSKESMVQAAEVMAAEKYEVGSLMYIIIIKVILAIIEHMLLSGEMPSDDELTRLTQSND